MVFCCSILFQRPLWQSIFMKSNKIICFGEILWDIFEDGKKLGGAPFNVTNSLKDLGADVEFISRIGKDFLGNEILKELKSRGVSTIFLQEDHPLSVRQEIYAYSEHPP